MHHARDKFIRIWINFSWLGLFRLLFSFCVGCLRGSLLVILLRIFSIGLLFGLFCFLFLFGLFSWIFSGLFFREHLWFGLFVKRVLWVFFIGRGVQLYYLREFLDFLQVRVEPSLNSNLGRWTAIWKTGGYLLITLEITLCKRIFNICQQRMLFNHLFKVIADLILIKQILWPLKFVLVLLLHICALTVSINANCDKLPCLCVQICLIYNFLHHFETVCNRVSRVKIWPMRSRLEPILSLLVTWDLLFDGRRQFQIHLKSVHFWLWKFQVKNEIHLAEPYPRLDRFASTKHRENELGNLDPLRFHIFVLLILESGLAWHFRVDYAPVSKPERVENGLEGIARDCACRSRLLLFVLRGVNLTCAIVLTFLIVNNVDGLLERLLVLCCNFSVLFIHPVFKSVVDFLD